MAHHNPIAIPAELVELLGDAALDLQALARGCRVSPDWVVTRVESGVLLPDSGGAAAEWRFAGATLVRARRLAGLEQTFEADPQLAALTVDLMEEVVELRRRLHQLI